MLHHLPNGYSPFLRQVWSPLMRMRRARSTVCLCHSGDFVIPKCLIKQPYHRAGSEEGTDTEKDSLCKTRASRPWLSGWPDQVVCMWRDSPTKWNSSLPRRRYVQLHASLLGYTVQLSLAWSGFDTRLWSTSTHYYVLPLSIPAYS